jgi:hypothetical protein
LEDATAAGFVHYAEHTVAITGSGPQILALP